jgi:hypothetical protein
MTPGPNTATDFGRSCQSKTVVVHDEPVAELCEHRRNAGARARGDHDGAGNDAHSVDVERVLVDEAGVTANAIRFRNALNALQHESHEAIALAAHAVHHLASVDAGRAGMDPEARCAFHAWAASAAAMRSFDGMQPTRAHVVP